MVHIVVFFILPILVLFSPVLGLLEISNEQRIGLGSFHVVYMLEGGVLTLSLTLVLFATISRRWLYILFAGWLIGNLRITALSMGWDMQWLGQNIPPDSLMLVRKLTCAVYYLLTFALFIELFNDSLARLRQSRLLRSGMLPGLILLVATPFLPYPEFAYLMWWMATIGVIIAIVVIGRLLATAYSSNILWYSAAMLIVIAAGTGVFDTLDTIFGSQFFSSAYIHVMAAVISSALIALVITENDRASRANAISALVTLAEHDPLTDTLNQRGIEKHTQFALNALKHGEPFALGYVDLASLKTVNDIYGHTAGDTVLKQVCTTISAKLGDNHYLGRIGGSELVLLLRNTSIDEAHALALAIMDELQTTPCHIGARALQLKTSMGLVEIANPELNPGDAILAAARACRMAPEWVHERVHEGVIGITQTSSDPRVLADDQGHWLRHTDAGAATDVRLRVAVRHTDKASAQRLTREVTALYPCGPAGGGGVRTALRPTLGTVSCPIDRALVPTGFRMLEGTGA